MKLRGRPGGQEEASIHYDEKEKLIVEELAKSWDQQTPNLPDGWYATAVQMGINPLTTSHRSLRQKIYRAYMQSQEEGGWILFVAPSAALVHF